MSGLTPARLCDLARDDIARNPRLEVGRAVRYSAYDGSLVGAAGVVVEVAVRPGPPFFVRFADDHEGWYWWGQLQRVGIAAWASPNDYD